MLKQLISMIESDAATVVGNDLYWPVPRLPVANVLHPPNACNRPGLALINMAGWIGFQSTGHRWRYGRSSDRHIMPVFLCGAVR